LRGGRASGDLTKMENREHDCPYPYALPVGAGCTHLARSRLFPEWCIRSERRRREHALISLMRGASAAAMTFNEKSRHIIIGRCYFVQSDGHSSYNQTSQNRTIRRILDSPNVAPKAAAVELIGEGKATRNVPAGAADRWIRDGYSRRIRYRPRTDARSTACYRRLPRGRSPPTRTIQGVAP